VRAAGGPGGVNHVRVVAHHVAPIAVARDEEKSGDALEGPFET
jgi:hypothetical protein